MIAEGGWWFGGLRRKDPLLRKVFLGGSVLQRSDWLSLVSNDSFEIEELEAWRDLEIWVGVLGGVIAGYDALWYKEGMILVAA